MKLAYLLGISCAVSLVTLSCSTEESDVIRPTCGNELLQPGEFCELHVDPYCAEDCQSSEGYCGDGIVQERAGEECDLGGGAGGEGGGGGEASGSSSPEGCDSCRLVFGFLCDQEASSCQQTGVPPEELAADYLEEVCVWIIGISGGTGNTFECLADDGTSEYLTPPDQSVCMERFNLNDSCTIGEFEEWSLGKSKCEINSETSPCH